MTKPTPPPNPLIVEGDAEGTSMYIDAALELLREYTQNHMGHEDEPGSDTHAWGVVYVLDGIQSAVKYLSHLEAMPLATLQEVKQ